MKITSTTAAAFAVLALASTVHANSIVGQIDFVGAPVLDGTNLGNATRVTSWGTVRATQATGSFAPVVTVFELGVADVATMATPWFFNSGSVTPLWSIAGFSFDLTSSAKNPTSTANFLDVSGSGFMFGNNFTRTAGTWTFNITNAANSSVFSFQSSTAARVPDGGTTVALLGLSFLGLGGISRFVRRK